jgi:hypothetical protein
LEVGPVDFLKGYFISISPTELIGSRYFQHSENKYIGRQIKEISILSKQKNLIPGSKNFIPGSIVEKLRLGR